MKFLTLLFLACFTACTAQATVTNPNLVITRAKDGYDRGHTVGLFIDSAYVTTLDPGETVPLRITEGSHRVLLIYGLLSTEQRITVTEHTQLTFTFLPAPRLY